MPDYVSPPALRDIITAMTAIEPDARPSLSEVQRQLLVIRHAMHAQGDTPRFISAACDTSAAASDTSRHNTAPPSPWEDSSTGGDYSDVFVEGPPSASARRSSALPFAAPSPGHRTDAVTLGAQSDRASTVDERLHSCTVDERLTSAAPSPVAIMTPFAVRRGPFGVALGGVADPEPPGTPNSGGRHLDQVRRSCSCRKRPRLLLYSLPSSPACQL